MIWKKAIPHAPTMNHFKCGLKLGFEHGVGLGVRLGNEPGAKIAFERITFLNKCRQSETLVEDWRMKDEGGLEDWSSAWFAGKSLQHPLLKIKISIFILNTPDSLQFSFPEATLRLSLTTLWLTEVKYGLLHSSAKGVCYYSKVLEPY